MDYNALAALDGEIVRLSADVQNPYKNGTYKWEWDRRKVIPKGTKFRVEVRTYEDWYSDPEEVLLLEAALRRNPNAAQTPEGKTVASITLYCKEFPGFGRKLYDSRGTPVPKNPDTPNKRQQLIQALVPLLVPAGEPKTLDQLLLRYGVSPRETLDALLGSGVLTLDDITPLLQDP